MTQVPQFFVEVIAFGALLSVAMYALASDSADVGALLPVLGLYALGALKLKPASNYIYSSVSKMKFGESAIDNIINDLKCFVNDGEVILNNDHERLTLKNGLIFDDISFFYPNCSKPALKNINIEIKANSSVGIIGTTGAGKSTFVDLILGLLQPTSGVISVDGKRIDHSNIRQWQNSIGYVPQNIFLADTSIASNIAFGIDEERIDMKQVELVAKMAQIHEFIATLDDGYNTEIGERGIRLSGGQRQRLGIARALYHNPDLLILDEATSALDSKTEAEVMKAVESLSGSKTIIMIAHRLSTVEKCDMIIKLENGMLVYK